MQLTGKERKEALRPRVDHINLVQRDRVNHLLSVLQLSVRARDEAGLA